MKIALITLHDTDNCGSSLQAFALQYYLIRLGHECELIDYVPNYTKDNGSPMKSLMKKIIFYSSKKNQDKSFKEFKEKYMITSKNKYRAYSELVDNPPVADLYMTGSDQLWNTYFKCGNDDAYYLKFIENVRKISYAVSLGRKDYSENEIKNLIQKINSYEKVTVREDSSKKLFHTMGKTDVECVCDPTLLLDKSVYESVKTTPIKSEYVFVYLTLKSDLLDLIIKRLKKENPNIKIVYYGSFRPHCVCDIHLKEAGPKEFLGLISNAKLVIAGSFHATIFSNIFEKNFFVLPSKNNERMIQFLEDVGLSDRYISDDKAVGALFKDIDYAKSKILLNRYIEKSKEILIGMI